MAKFSHGLAHNETFYRHNLPIHLEVDPCVRCIGKHGLRASVNRSLIATSLRSL
jgi:hypothetical protein